MGDFVASPSGVVIPRQTPRGDASVPALSGIASAGGGGGLLSARTPANLPMTARGLRGGPAPTPRATGAAAPTPRGGGMVASSSRGPSGSGVMPSGIAAGTPKATPLADGSGLGGSGLNRTFGGGSSTENTPLDAQLNRTSSAAGLRKAPSSPRPGASLGPGAAAAAAASAANGDDADPLAATAGSLKLEMTIAMSGKAGPRVSASASRADVILNLQAKLRDEYGAALMAPEKRGLFWTEGRKSGGAGSAALGGAEARAKAMMTGRRATQLNDPTQRATVTVVREDSMFVNASSNNSNNEQQQQGGQGGLDQVRGATCIADSLPARLAGPDGRGLGGVVVIQGCTGIGRSTIWRQLCAQQRVPEAIVIHVPLFKLRRFHTKGGASLASATAAAANAPRSARAQANQQQQQPTAQQTDASNINPLLRLEDLIRAIEGPLSSSDVASIVRHRIPVVWALDGFEGERRHCRDFVRRMVEMRRWRDVALTAGADDAATAAAASAAADDFWDSYADDEDLDLDASAGASAVANEAYALLTRKCDTVIVTSSDGTLSEEDGVTTLDALSATSVTSIARMASGVRASNVERWVVQRWPQQVTREFCRRYCTSKGKPFSSVEGASAAAAATTNYNSRTAAAGAASASASAGKHRVPAEDVVWRILSSGSFRTFAGIPLLVQCVCDVFLLNEALLPQLAGSQNPAVTLFDLLMKLQWARQLPHIQALLSSSVLNGSGTGGGSSRGVSALAFEQQQQQQQQGHLAQRRLSASVASAGADSPSPALSRSSSFAAASASFSRIAQDPDRAFKAMVDAAGQYCVDLIARGGMETDVTLRGGAGNANNVALMLAGEHSELQAGLAYMNERVAEDAEDASAQGEEPLWVKLLALLGVVKRITTSSTAKTATTTTAAINTKSSVGAKTAAAMAAATANSPSTTTTTVVFHNRLLVEYYAASHIARHPDALQRIRFHSSNRFLWTSLAFFSAQNSRGLSQLGFFSRISERYSKEHPLWLDALAEAVATQFHARYAALPEEMRHNRRKMLVLSEFTQCNLVVELSAILGNRSINAAAAAAGTTTTAAASSSSKENDADVLMNKIRRKHGFFGSTLRCPSHMMWSFELCGEFAALPTLNWLIDKYAEEFSFKNNKALLSRTLARALKREQLGGADRAGGVIHRLRQLGATIELFNAVALGSTTAVAECLETAGVTLDADAYRRCLMIAVENRDSDMAALLLAHARIAEALDAWIVAAVFVLSTRVRFCRHSVQHTLENDRSRNAAVAAASQSAARATSSDAMMGTLEFLDQWSRGCGGLAEQELSAVNVLMHQILSKQSKMAEVHTAAVAEGGAAATFAAAIASLDSPEPPSHRNVQLLNDLDFGATAASLGVSVQQPHRTPSGVPTPAASIRKPPNDGDDDDDDVGEVDLSSTIIQAGGAVAAAAALAAAVDQHHSSSRQHDFLSAPVSPPSTVRRGGGVASPVSFASGAGGHVADSPSSTTTTSPRSARSRATSFFSGFSYGTDFVVEIRIDAIFWWRARPDSALAVRPTEGDGSGDDSHYVPFNECPDSLQLLGIVQSVADCESVKHIILRLQECQSLTDATLIQLVHSAGPKLVELAVTWAAEITDAALLSLTRYCRNLAALDVTRCYCIGNNAMIAAASHLHHLRALTIEFCGLVDDEGVIALCESDPLIERLSVAYCTMLTDRAMLVVAQRLRSLRSLNISGCAQMTDVALVNVALNCGSTLSELYFRDITEITDAGVVCVAENLKDRLAVVDAAVCWRLSDAAVVALGEHCPNLEQLFLSDVNAVGDKGIRSLAKSSSGRIRVLDISGCFCVSAKALLELCAKSYATLEQLHVSRCDGVDDDFIEAVCRNCPQLMALACSYCELLTDRALVAVLGTRSRLREFQCMPTPRQEREVTFTATLMQAVAEKMEQRRIRGAEEKP